MGPGAFYLFLWICLRCAELLLKRSLPQTLLRMTLILWPYHYNTNGNECVTSIHIPGSYLSLCWPGFSVFLYIYTTLTLNVSSIFLITPTFSTFIRLNLSKIRLSSYLCPSRTMQLYQSPPGIWILRSTSEYIHNRYFTRKSLICRVLQPSLRCSDAPLVFVRDREKFARGPILSTMKMLSSCTLQWASCGPIHATHGIHVLQDTPEGEGNRRKRRSPSASYMAWWVDHSRL